MGKKFECFNMLVLWMPCLPPLLRLHQKFIYPSLCELLTSISNTYPYQEGNEIAFAEIPLLGGAGVGFQPSKPLSYI